MRLREPLLVSVVTVLALATPVVTMSPAVAASAKAPTIVGVVPSTAAVRTGAKLSVKIVAENESKTLSASYRLQFLLSKTTSPTGARKIGEGTLSSFAAKTRKTFGFSLTIPSNAAAGSFRLLLCHPRAGEPLRCHQDNIKLTVTLAPAKLTISPTSHNYGDVVVNDGGGKRFTVRNVGRRWSGPVTVSLSGTQASSFGFIGYSCGPSLAPQATCTIDAVFSPTSVGTFHASLKVKPSANYSTGATASLSGTGVIPAQLAIAPLDDFGSVVTGTASPAQTVTVSNTGSQPAGPIAITITGYSYEDFVFTDNTCAGVALAGGASCTVKVKYGPLVPGASTATFTASATPGGPVTTPLTGTGVAPAAFTVTPSPYSFGSVEVGTPATKNFTVTNTGGVPTGPMGYHLTGSSWFSGSGTTCPSGGLAASASCTITIQFLPTADDANTAQLVVTGAPTPPATVNLSGTGATPPAFTLTPSSLSFDDQAVGTTSVKTLTLKNTGGLPSGNLSIYFNGSGFEIDGATTTCAGPLAGGASCTIGVRFEPDAVWSFGGLVNALAHPPGFSGLATASVSGNGINPPV